MSCQRPIQRRIGPDDQRVVDFCRTQRCQPRGDIVCRAQRAVGTHQLNAAIAGYGDAPRPLAHGAQVSGSRRLRGSFSPHTGMLTQRDEQFLPQSGLVVRGLQDHNFFEYGADRFPQVTQSVQNRGNAIRPPRCSTIGDLRQRAEAIGEGLALPTGKTQEIALLQQAPGRGKKIGVGRSTPEALGVLHHSSDCSHPGRGGRSSPPKPQVQLEQGQESLRPDPELADGNAVGQDRTWPGTSIKGRVIYNFHLQSPCDAAITLEAIRLLHLM